MSGISLGPWQVPAGLRAVDDGFGGQVGVFTVEAQHLLTVGDNPRFCGCSAPFQFDDAGAVDAVVGREFSTDAFYCRTSKDRIAREESPQVVSGQSILLSTSGRRYEYHASGQTVIFCRPLP